VRPGQKCAQQREVSHICVHGPEVVTCLDLPREEPSSTPRIVASLDRASPSHHRTARRDRGGDKLLQAEVDGERLEDHEIVGFVGADTARQPHHNHRDTGYGETDV
jgi:hypothetical protein